MNESIFSASPNGPWLGKIPRAIVAIPVRNEEERVAACLGALARQEGLGDIGLGIVLLLNNCTDRTASVIDAIEMPWPVRVIVRDDPAASAGWARRLAMEAASAWLAESRDGDGILLTSDADSRVGADWVARNVAVIAGGADLVAGRISLEPDEAVALPARLHNRGRLEARYEALLIEIEARLDPEPGNPWPCHWSKSGATLAVRHTVYLAVGGMPDIATGEDRAFVDAVRDHDFIVRHDCSIDVITSGRLDGRAAGGVAETIRLRCDEPESPCDARLEKLYCLVSRVLWRRRLRRLYGEGRLAATLRWAPDLAIPKPIAELIALSPYFGRAYAAIEATSPKLAYQPIRPKSLPRQIASASLFLWTLRLVGSWKKQTQRRRTASLRVAEHQSIQT